jgi:hypothetical protein
MKTTLKSILTLALVMGLGIMAHAQKTLSASASAIILADLTITLAGDQDEIRFGNLSSNTPGEVVLDANGNTNENANTGTDTDVARFELAGADNPVTVRFDTYVDLLNDAGDNMRMTPKVVGATVNTAQATASAVGIGDQVNIVAGAYFLWVGGTIDQLTDQPMGDYSGTFNIDVEYN